MQKILIFGASGDTGKYLVDYFLSTGLPSGYEILALGTRATDYFAQRNVPYIQLDITKQDQFSSLPNRDVYAVINLAGMMPARMKGYDPQKYVDVNITGTLNILEYCRSSSVDRILFAQSFGDIKENAEHSIVLHPDAPKNFSFANDHTVYVLTKNFAVDLLKNYRQVYGIKDFVFRLPTIYLWSSIDSYYVDGIQRKIGYRLLIDKAIKGEQIEIWGDKTRKKDMVYVKDFCQMLYKATFVDRQFGYYNVGTGIGTTLEDQIRGIVEVFGSSNNRSPIVYRPDMPNAPQYIMDITAAVNELDYKPKFNYLLMLEDMKRTMLEA